MMNDFKGEKVMLKLVTILIRAGIIATIENRNFNIDNLYNYIINHYDTNDKLVKAILDGLS